MIDVTWIILTPIIIITFALVSHALSLMYRLKRGWI